jgi:hypothetical protein
MRNDIMEDAIHMMERVVGGGGRGKRWEKRRERRR